MEDEWIIDNFFIATEVAEMAKKEDKKIEEQPPQNQQ